MADRDAIERRLLRAGLDEVRAEEVIADHLYDLDGFQRWLESVHDDDIKEKFNGETAEEPEDGVDLGNGSGSGS